MDTQGLLVTSTPPEVTVEAKLQPDMSQKLPKYLPDGEAS